MNIRDILIYSASTLFLFLLFSTSALAQQQTVKGTVTDKGNGKPLIGVNIAVKGTSQGTVSDQQGNYSLQVPSAQDTLVFSYIGYKSQTIPISGQTTIDVAMEPNVVKGKELVVVGYGTQTRSNLTSSITIVDSSEITEVPSLTATGALQGKVTGVNIIQNHAPGGTPSVILRGLGTALGGRNPLYIVDGVPTDNINNIAPSDIKSMEFLKDAAAASIYGLRAANGVIIVTTKSGHSGKAQFSVKGYAGYKAILNKVKMANNSQYIEYFNEQENQNKKYVGAENTFQLSKSQQYHTNWYDELLKPSYTANTTVSVSGGSDQITYFLSYNLNKQKGLLAGQNFWRQTLRDNNKYHLFGDFLEIDQNLNISISKETPKPFSAFDNAYFQSPIVPVHYSNGRYGQPLVDTETGKLLIPGENSGAPVERLNDKQNPAVSVDLTNKRQKTIELQGKVAAIFNITDYLTFTSRLGATKFFANNRTFTPVEKLYLAGDPTKTAAEFKQNKKDHPDATQWANNKFFKYHNETLHWNWDNFINFTDSFGKHNVKATLGISSEKIGTGYNFSGLAYDVPRKSQYWSLDLSSGQYQKEVNQISYTPNTLQSYFGRVQ